MIVLLKIFFLNPEANLSQKNLSVTNFLLLFLMDFIAVVFVLVLDGLFFGINTNSSARNFEQKNQDIVLIIVLGLVFFPILEEFSSLLSQLSDE